MPYHQLTLQEREMIAVMCDNGRRQATIARALGRSPGTISRELARYRPTPSPNGFPGMLGYIGGEAHRQARSRRASANARRARIGDNALGETVRRGLAARWSPQQIGGRLKLDHPGDPSMRISHEAVYQWVYQQARLGEPWHRCLRRGRKRRRSRVPVRQASGAQRFRTPGVGIDQRPPVVDQRSRIGDWESDTMAGSQRSRAVLATHLERRSRYVLIRKLTNARAKTFNRASVAALKAVPAEHRRTLTADNGSEFARFATLQKKLGLKVYFAQPYKAWQRGANENANGLIRQFFPKGTDLSTVSPKRVAQVERLLNNRPRKCLNYRTPAEVFRPPPGVALRN